MEENAEQDIRDERRAAKSKRREARDEREA